MGRLSEGASGPSPTPLQLADGERRCRVVEAEFASYREASRAQPESQLQAQISMLQLEKVRARTPCSCGE